jgi:serine/threonine-protein kinase
MIANPFSFGNPIRDPGRFYGREREIRQVVGRLLSPAFESTSIVGERRIGKTSLLNYLAHPDTATGLGLSRDQYVVVFLDFGGCTDVTPLRFWERALQKTARALADDDLAATARELGGRDEIDQYDLEDLFLEIEERGKQLVLLMDEFEYVTQNPNFGLGFFSGLRALAIHCPLALVTSTRQELVDLCHSDAIKGSPFFNIFANVVLRPFDLGETSALIDGSLEGTGVSFTEDVRAFLAEIAGGHPLFIQMAAHYCFEGHQMGVEGEALRKHLAEGFSQQAEPHFAYLWSHSRESERITLLALLALAQGKKGSPTQDRLFKTYARAAYALPDLKKRGLALERDGRIVLFSPLFGRWLSAEMSAGAGEEADEQTAEEWLEKRGGIERPAWNRVKRAFPKLKQSYWPLLGEFIKETSSEVAAQVILQMGGM